MKKVIAGYFDYVIEKQKIEVVANVPVMSEGQIVFEEDKVTPRMTTEIIETEIDVRQRVWIPQREVELTEDELKQREVDHQEHLRSLEADMALLVAKRRGELMDALLRSQTEALIMSAGNALETDKIRDDFIGIKAMINKAQTLEELEMVANS